MSESFLIRTKSEVFPCTLAIQRETRSSIDHNYSKKSWSQSDMARVVITQLAISWEPH
jgi:hypothetical protein